LHPKSPTTEVAMMILGLDHVQLAMPKSEEEKARAFYGKLLGLQEIPKPEALVVRGGVWFTLPDGRQIHLGVETPFYPARKAHPAFVVANLDDLATPLTDAGFAITWDDLIPGVRRFYCADPFENRLEFLAKSYA
jgi:catechol 2,3-dioxygenase-like lactoylglutathione lyase family enzyme